MQYFTESFDVCRSTTFQGTENYWASTRTYIRLTPRGYQKRKRKDLIFCLKMFSSVDSACLSSSSLIPALSRIPTTSAARPSYLKMSLALGAKFVPMQTSSHHSALPLFSPKLPQAAQHTTGRWAGLGAQRRRHAAPCCRRRCCC